MHYRLSVEWEECPYCGAKVPPKLLAEHWHNDCPSPRASGRGERSESDQ